MADDSLDKSVYSRHFNTLRYLGAWVVDTNNAIVLNAYVAYKTVMTVFGFAGCFSLFFDFYFVLDDFKKITWNLCVSALFTGGFLKNIYTIHRRNVINKLRARLHEKEKHIASPRDEAVNALGVRELRKLQIMFYGAVVLFVPLWLTAWYLSNLWGPREIPLPLRLPIQLDLNNNLEYNLTFFSVSSIGCLALTVIVETELSMFTILIQISREYNRLLGDLSSINKLYQDPPELCRHVKSQIREVNSCLRKIRTKELMKKFSTSQQQLIEFTKDFELGYSFSMLLQVFVLSVLIIVSAVQCILEYDSLSLHLSYQIGYISVLLADMFLVCWFATKIREQCLKVGEVAYATLWYRMDSDIQRDICMIIMRSQDPPKITSGKIMEMNLHAFMVMMRNIYSWLALFQQLAFK